MIKKSRKRKSTTQQQGCNPKRVLTDAEVAEEKRKQRLVRNRASAQLSRDRKKLHLKNLELKVKQLTEENKQLKAQLQSLHNIHRLCRCNSSSGSPSSEYEDTMISVSSTGHLSSGLAMFAFVFAFGLFFHITGLNFGTASKFSPAVVPTGRTLSSFPQFSQPHSEIFDLSNHDIPWSDQGQDVSQVVHQQLHSVVSSEASEPSKYKSMEMSIFREKNDEDTDYAGTVNRLYEKLIWANETVETNSSYFFVPSIFSMFDRNSAVMSEVKPSAHSGDKVSGFISGSEETPKSNRLTDKISTGDLLYLWMPTATLSWGSAWNRHVHKAQDDATMYELACTVGRVRPLPFTLF